MSDTILIMSDLNKVISTFYHNADAKSISHKLEEVLCNYNIKRKEQLRVENDFQEKIEIFISSRKIEGLSDKTLVGYRIELGMFAKYVNKGVSQITTPDIRNYLSSNKKWLITTVDRKLSVLKTFFGWLVREEILVRDPSAKINAPKKPKRLPKGLSVEELEIVRDSCKTLRERALVEVAYSTACRLSELMNMKILDINPHDLSIKVIGKGDRERITYLSIKAMHQLKKYLNSRNDNCEYLFVTERKPHRQMADRTMGRIIDKVKERANISKDFTLHSFRHSFATNAMSSGADLADVQNLLGHQDPSTTLVYSHISEERIKLAHKRFHIQ